MQPAASEHVMLQAQSHATQQWACSRPQRGGAADPAQGCAAPHHAGKPPGAHACVPVQQHVVRKASCDLCLRRGASCGTCCPDAEARHASLDWSPEPGPHAGCPAAAAAAMSPGAGFQARAGGSTRLPPGLPLLHRAGQASAPVVCVALTAVRACGLAGMSCLHRDQWLCCPGPPEYALHAGWRCQGPCTNSHPIS